MKGRRAKADPMGTSHVSASHRLQDLAVRGATAFFRLVPEPLALGLGWAAGWIAGSVFRVRRRVVEENLRRAFPDAPEAWHRKIAARVFPHIAREAVALLLLSGLSTDRVRSRIRFEGRELVRDAVEAGRGGIILTGHIGNWEVGGGATALSGIPLDAVVQAQSNPLVDRRLRRTREMLGVRVIYRQDAPREVLRSLRRGRMVALLADQNARAGGVFVDFFGVPASTARGPAIFARRTGAPVILATAVRLPGWRARYRLRFRLLDAGDADDAEEASEGVASGGRADVAEDGGGGGDAPVLRDPARRDEELIRRYHAALEEAIREVPEQYFWPHKRWKTRPEDRTEPEEPRGTVPV